MNTEPSAFPRKYKIIAYVAAWIVALLMVEPGIGYGGLAWMFPLGLIAFLYPSGASGGGWGVLITGYAVYLAHAWFYFRSREKRSTLIFYAVLVLLLVCNAAGCRQMIKAP